jgi:glutamyl-tRNA synthetase
VNGIQCNENKLLTLIPIIKPRINFLHEVWDQSWFFFNAPSSYDPAVIKKRWKEQTPEQMSIVAERLEACKPFTPESIDSAVKEVISEHEWGMGAIMNAWRLLLVGEAKGPGLFDLAAFLGKDEVISRMKTGIDAI